MRSQPLVLRIFLDEIARKRFEYQFLQDQYEQSEAPTGAKDNPPHAVIARNGRPRRLRIGQVVIGMQLDEGSVLPEDKYLVVGEREDDHDHEGEVGEEVLPPRLGDTERDHGDDVEIVDKDKNGTRLQPVSELRVVIVVGTLRHVHAAELTVVLRISSPEYRDYRYLTSQLYRKGRDHLE